MNQNHRQNLQKLADYLTTLPSENFNMSVFREANHPLGWLQPLQPTDPEPECGTVCCAVGHGPAAGLPVIEDDFLWILYLERVFGLTTRSPEYNWMFDAEWSGIDNTPQGAAKRINHYLAHGLPYNHGAQRHGLAPYLFAGEPA